MYKELFAFFSVDDVEKFYLYANRNSKYLLYKFNDWIESLQGAKNLLFEIQKKQKILYV